MAEDFGPSQRQHSGDLGIQDLLRGDAGQAADRAVEDGKNAIEPVLLDVAVPDVVRSRSEDRVEPPITQCDHTARIHDEAGLEVERGKAVVDLVCVAGEVQIVVGGDGAEAGVLRAIGAQACLLDPRREVLPERKGREKVLGKHDQLQVGPDPALGGRNVPGESLEGGGDHGPRLGGRVDCVHLELQSQRSVAKQFAHGSSSTSSKPSSRSRWPRSVYGRSRLGGG